jgi:hypothetical protein
VAIKRLEPWVRRRWSEPKIRKLIVPPWGIGQPLSTGTVDCTTFKDLAYYLDTGCRTGSQHGVVELAKFGTEGTRFGQ